MDDRYQQPREAWSFSQDPHAAASAVRLAQREAAVRAKGEDVPAHARRLRVADGGAPGPEHLPTAALAAARRRRAAEVRRDHHAVRRTLRDGPPRLRELDHV